MIKSYPTRDALVSAGVPTNESRVALVEDENDVVVDGVNVIKSIPEFGDPIFTDASGKTVIIDAASLVPSLIPSGWAYKGPFLIDWDKGYMAVFNGDFTSLPTRKFADVVQFEVTIPAASGEMSLGAQFVSAGTTTTVTVQYDSSEGLASAANTYEESGDTLCGKINLALKAIDGITGTWWAYLDDNGKVILQRDTWTDYRQYTCSGALTHVTWGDMPAASTYLKANGRITNYRGIQNIAGGAVYWGVSGRDLTADVAVGSEAGNTNPMKLSEYQSSPYAAAIRAAYPTYEDYLRGEFGIPLPQGLGCFALPDGKELTEKYGPITAPTKDGGSKAKFPALNWAYSLGDNNHLWDVTEGTLIMEDGHLSKLNATQSRMGKVTISAATYRWFAQRYGVYNAWFFIGTSRYLGYYFVSNVFQVGAVTLLPK